MSSCAKPIADFSIISSSKKVITEQKFENKSSKATSYTWDFGDGNTSTEVSPAHKYTHSGKYEVTLKQVTEKNQQIKRWN